MWYARGKEIFGGENPDGQNRLGKMIDLATAGFGLVAALAVTALAVWVTSYLGKLAALRKGKDPGEDGREKAANGAGEGAEAQPAIQGAVIEEAILRAMIRWREMEGNDFTKGGR
ncbi:hypothetical protein [Kyrpidia spormannii]|uniref:Uncharacterized protein n=1 Tax=Kyrpidia spormannii TaxID=2055160 RepID=A0ACA8ZDE3_9BACL|nr:hypothetical protein [Kyrpidia spormannii]CAB3395002.1 conserved protein of unknown function [Kyrpidia spormannii]